MSQEYHSAVFYSYPTDAFAAVLSTNNVELRNDLVAGVEYILQNTDVQNIVV